MATSEHGRGSGAGRGRALAYLESRKNLTGSAAGVVGVALTFSGVAGPYWPAVVAGLYAAGALIAPPERPDVPAFRLDSAPEAELDAVREDFGRLKAYLAEADVPAPASERLAELIDTLDLILDKRVASSVAGDERALHTVSRAIRADIPTSVDTFVRTRWWTRLQPGTEVPERQLERQLLLLRDQARRVVADLRRQEEDRQRAHGVYLDTFEETGSPLDGPSLLDTTPERGPDPT